MNVPLCKNENKSQTMHILKISAVYLMWNLKVFNWCQRLICTEVTSYKIHILAESSKPGKRWSGPFSKSWMAFISYNIFFFKLIATILWFEMKLLIYDQNMTISGLVFVIFMSIFHKTEVPMAILMCFRGLNLDCFKSYGLRCRLRPHACSANSQSIATDK